MREIKFIAWDKKRNSMINHIREIDFALGKIKSEYDLDVIDGQNSGNYYRGFEHIELMQYTGLKDKNGKEIYEGDIIHSDYSDGRPCRHIIRYNNNKGSFVAENLDGFDSILKTDSGISQSWLTEYNKIVIGNIYEKPELLESKIGEKNND